MVSMIGSAFLVGFVIGILTAITMAIIYDKDSSIDKIQLADYYKALAEKEWFKQQYRDLHYVLEHLNNRDVELFNREHYNHFIVKKPKGEDYNLPIWEDW